MCCIDKYLLERERFFSSKLEIENRNLKEEKKHLLGMIEWIAEAHGNSITTEYTIDEKPWKLKDYILENLTENYPLLEPTILIK